jgi:hypothetical protein
MKTLHVIYVPGLGDERVTAQRLVVRAWQLWGVEAEVCQMHWSDAEPWEHKLGRLLARIDALVAEGKTPALVGSSAGASAVINAYALRSSQVVGCVLIAAKINNAAAIGEVYRRENPAFIHSAQACEKSLASLDEAARKRILSRIGLYDGVVPQRDSYIAGARNQTVPTFGHAFTIAAQIVLGASSFLRFLKNLAA